ncbi:MAG TPA: bifunctional hydroxymethylpyrimidine kinase/phosphomethylpyrimidine kinase [Candidatus Polarisedimenticolia bacterium]|nr:bifunctional hydroxymethylpyrimidine kinase/phosphomethylpyrimidine kinase [Candidatus Polarisedimenticolia bacterium]
MSRPRRRRGPSHRLRTPGGPRAADTQAAPPPAIAPPFTAPELARTVLAVAGLDPSGGAGVAADLKTIAAYRHHGAAVVTSVTAQNTLGVQAIYDLPMEFVAQQIESVVSDLTVHAVKIGMLGTQRTAELIASLARSLDLRQVVLDPVLRSTSGTPLLEPAGIASVREKLLPCVEVVTPNMEEAQILTGRRVTDLASMKDAARALHDMGARNVVVTGGHLGQRAIDVLFDGRAISVFDSAKIASTSTHGIGCTFSAAIACLLARGAEVVEAVDSAKRYVSRAVAHAGRIGRGAGPLNHLVSPF